MHFWLERRYVTTLNYRCTFMSALPQAQGTKTETRWILSSLMIKHPWFQAGNWENKDKVLRKKETKLSFECLDAKNRSKSTSELTKNKKQKTTQAVLQSTQWPQLLLAEGEPIPTVCLEQQSQPGTSCKFLSPKPTVKGAVKHTNSVSGRAI